MKFKKNISKGMVLCMSILISSSILVYQKTVKSYASNHTMFEKSIIKNISGSEYDTFSSTIESKYGGLIVAGRSRSDDIGIDFKGGESDAILVKYDEYGNQIWMRSFGGNEYDGYSSVTELKDGDIVAVGNSTSTDLEIPNGGSNDAIIVKYDKDGNQLWVNCLAGNKNETFTSVRGTKDGGFIVVGNSDSTNIGFENKGNRDAIILKYDKDGNQIWKNNFGGSGYDYFKSVVETSDKGFIVAGDSSSTDAGFNNKGSSDGIIIKYDGKGNQQWIKSFGGSSNDYFNSVIEVENEEIIIVGNSNSINTELSNKGQSDAIILKYDKDGNQLWVKNFGGSKYDIFYSVSSTQKNSFIAVGYSKSTDAGFEHKDGGKYYDAIMVKYDTEGNQLYVKSLGGNNFDSFTSIMQSKKGDLVVIGNSYSEDLGFSSSGDAVLLYYNEEYECIFDKLIQCENTASISDIEIIRDLINKIPEGVFKEYFQNRLNEVEFDEVLELKTASANLDLYIKSENILLMSLDTNSVAFEDFSGIEDVEKINAVNITINSSLPYQLNAYLPMEIQNSDKTNTMDKRILNIKENSEADYKEFANINEKVVLKDNCPAGNDLVHGIDLKLKGGIAHEKDVYKTTIKFETEQK